MSHLQRFPSTMAWATLTLCLRPEQWVDTLIMGMRDSDALRALFGIPDGEEVMAVIALGHRASDPVKPTRKPLDEIAKFF